MKSVLFFSCLIATAVSVPATPNPSDAYLERDGALASTQIAVLQANEHEVHAVVVDMPQRASLEYASPETWVTLPTFDPPDEESPTKPVLQVAVN